MKTTIFSALIFLSVIFCIDASAQSEDAAQCQATYEIYTSNDTYMGTMTITPRGIDRGNIYYPESKISYINFGTNDKYFTIVFRVDGENHDENIKLSSIGDPKDEFKKIQKILFKCPKN